jgi:hypothetical protein
LRVTTAGRIACSAHQLVLALQTRPSLLGPRQLVTQAGSFSAQILARFVVGRGPLSHATVMPDSASWYKYRILDSSGAIAPDPLHKDEGCYD